MKALHLSQFSPLAVLAILLSTSIAAAANRGNIYNESADSRVDIAAAVAKAQAENKNVLIQWGGNWCGWCHLLHELFNEDEAIRNVLAENFEIVMIDSRSNRELAKEMGTQFSGVPYLTVLNAKTAHHHRTGDRRGARQTD